MTVFLVLCLLLAADACSAYIQLDRNEQREQIYTCGIDGLVDQNVHQLHGDLVDCQSPPMECFLDSGEFLVKSRTSIHCRLPSEDLFFNDDRDCMFRYYYRRSYCSDDCFSLTMTCVPIVTPTLVLYSLIASVAIVIVLFLSCICYCICCCCCCRTKTPKESIGNEETESLRKFSQELYSTEPRRSPKELKPLRKETNL